MATPDFGRLPEFSGSPSSWRSWYGRLQFFFEANEITDASKKRAHLLTLCGEQTYDIVCALVQPKQPNQVSYEDIVKMLKAHFDPQPSEVFCRARFQRRDQKHDETVSDYVTALKKLAADCNFGTSADTAANPTMLPMDVMLRDRFVCGLRNEQVQQRLFAEKDLTFKKAFDLALRAENAIEDQKRVKTEFKEFHESCISTCKIDNQGHSSASAQKKKQRCWRCNALHNPDTCKFQTVSCNYCKKRGHIEKACLKKRKEAKTSNSIEYPQQGTSTAASAPVSTQQDSSDVALYELNTVTNAFSTQKVMTRLRVHGKFLDFEVDSGAACTLISEVTFKATWTDDRPRLQTDNMLLRTWSGQSLRVLGCATVIVTHGNKTMTLPLVVIKGAGCNLLGRNWFPHLGIQITGINDVSGDELVSKLLDKYQSVFDEDISGHIGPAVQLDLVEGAKPKFLKARPVPFALRSAVEAELDRLQSQGIIEPAQHSDWATPLVLVRKKNGSLRICGDYRCTVNQVSKKTDYPLPSTDEVLSHLRGGKVFSTLDLAQAYQQLHVTPETAEILTLNTLKGLYRVKRLPFGISAAPAIFQRFMETMLSGITGVCAYLDDVIISGKDATEHAERLEEVLKRLRNYNLRLGKNKCCFAVRQVFFLGHRIDETGVHTNEEKVRAITDAPAPNCKQALQSFLGMLAFYDRFLKNRATVASCLYQLLQKDATWRWETKHQEAFDKLKALLLSQTVLAHYDEQKELLVSCDASPYGIGAVLSQRDDQNREAPIAFASRTLGPAERKYAQLDREGLAVVFAAHKFHKYIAGRKVTFVTDHQPLLGILGPQKPTAQVLSPRMTRWCIKLSAYDYSIIYRRGKNHQNADALSRLPLQERLDEPWPPGDVLLFEALSRPPLTAAEIARLTQQDSIMQRLYKAVQDGTVEKLTGDEFAPYRRRATALALHRECITLGSRVIIPSSARSRVLALLHAGHRGMVAMKKCARSYVWWPGMDKVIEETVRQCRECQATQKSPPKAPIPTWDRPQTAWNTVHVDFAGPLLGRTYLVVVDAYTKWVEVRHVTQATSAAVIDVLRSLFATFGIPRKVISDNGKAFISNEIKQFYASNGIQAATSPAYHPATNGQAERYVAELKRALLKDADKSIQCRLARFLYRQHTTIHTTTGMTPARAMFGRELLCPLDLLKRETDKRSPESQEALQESRRFAIGDRVLIRQFLKKPDWIEGEILRRVGPRSWLVKSDQGKVRRHLNHMRKTSQTRQTTQSRTDWSAADDLLDATPEETPSSSAAQPPESPEMQDHTPSQPSTSQAVATRQLRPPEVRRPPDRYGDFV